MTNNLNSLTTNVNFISGSVLNSEELNSLQDLIRSQIVIENKIGNIILLDYDTDNYELFFQESVINYKQYIFKIPEQSLIFLKTEYDSPDNGLFIKIEKSEVYENSPYYSKIDFTFVIDNLTKKGYDNYIYIGDKVNIKNKPKFKRFIHPAEMIESFNVEADYNYDNDLVTITVKNGVARINNTFFSGIYQKTITREEYFDTKYVLLSYIDDIREVEVEFSKTTLDINKYTDLIIINDIKTLLKYISLDDTQNNTFKTSHIASKSHISTFTYSNLLNDDLNTVSIDTSEYLAQSTVYSQLNDDMSSIINTTYNNLSNKTVARSKLLYNSFFNEDLTAEIIDEPTYLNPEISDYLSKKIFIDKKIKIIPEKKNKIYLEDSFENFYIEKTVPLHLKSSENIDLTFFTKNDIVCIVNSDTTLTTNSGATLTKNEALNYKFGIVEEVLDKEIIIQIEPTYQKNIDYTKGLYIGKVKDISSATLSLKWESFYEKFLKVPTSVPGYIENIFYPILTLEIKDSDNSISNFNDGSPILIELSNSASITKLYQESYSYEKIDLDTITVLNKPTTGLLKDYENHYLDCKNFIEQLTNFNDNKTYHVLLNFDNSLILAGETFLKANDSETKAIRNYYTTYSEDNIFNVEDSEYLMYNELNNVFAPAELHRFGRCYSWNSDNHENFSINYPTKRSYLSFTNPGFNLWLFSHADYKDELGNVIGRVYARFLVNKNGFLNFYALNSKPANIETIGMNTTSPTYLFDQIIFYDKKGENYNKLTGEEARSILMGEYIVGSTSMFEYAHLYNVENILHIVLRNNSEEFVESRLNTLDFTINLETLFDNYSDFVDYFFKKTENFERNVYMLRSESGTAKENLKSFNFNLTNKSFPITFKRNLTKLVKKDYYSCYATYLYGIIGTSIYDEDVNFEPYESYDLKKIATSRFKKYFDYKTYNNSIEHSGIYFIEYSKKDNYNYNGSITKYNEGSIKFLNKTFEIENTIGIQHIQVFKDNQIKFVKDYNIGTITEFNNYKNNKKYDDFEPVQFSISEDVVIKSIHINVSQSSFNKIKTNGILFVGLINSSNQEVICEGSCLLSQIKNDYVEIFFREHCKIFKNNDYLLCLKVINSHLTLNIDKSYFTTIKYSVSDTQYNLVSSNNNVIFSNLYNPNAYYYSLTEARPIIELNNLGDLEVSYDTGSKKVLVNLNGSDKSSSIMNLNSFLVLESLKFKSSIFQFMVDIVLNPGVTKINLGADFICFRYNYKIEAYFYNATNLKNGSPLLLGNPVIIQGAFITDRGNFNGSPVSLDSEDFGTEKAYYFPEISKPTETFNPEINKVVIKVQMSIDKGGSNTTFDYDKAQFNGFIVYTTS